MSTLIRAVPLVYHAAPASTGPGPVAPSTTTVIALLVAIILLLWAVRLMRPAFTIVAELVQVALRAALVGVLIIGVLALLVIALVIH
jgi:hypothetical protein